MQAVESAFFKSAIGFHLSTNNEHIVDLLLSQPVLIPFSMEEHTNWLSQT